MTGRPINESRALALITGDKTYEGAEHSKCGTTTRYVSGGGCVHCARLIASEQREARKFLQANPDVNQSGNEELDSPAPDELIPETAADRRRHAIDDLM